MEYLKTILIENELSDIKQTIITLHKNYYTKVKIVTEGVLDFESNDLGYMFEEARKRFQAAQNAVKIANKLGDPEQKSRVFRNLNQLRGLVARLTKTVEADLAEMEAQLQGKQTFDQRAVPRSNTSFGRSQQQPQAERRPAKRFNQPTNPPSRFPQ